MTETNSSRSLRARKLTSRTGQRKFCSLPEQLEARCLMAADDLASYVTDLSFDPIAEPAILMPGSNANTDAASLLAAGGPGDPSLPGFNNVSRSGDNGTVIYLGDGWALTANHVALTPTISWAGQSYTVDMSSVTRLTNADGSSTDLKMFRVLGDPQVPNLLTSYIASAPATGHVFMVGNGFSSTGEHFWSVNKTSTPWVWTEIAEPAKPTYTNYAGVTLSGSHNVRWGENMVHDSNLYMPIGGVNVAGFTTRFDRQAYTGEAALPNEAEAASGDSGGAVFSMQDGRWVLSGVMLAVSGSLSGQPSNTTLYGSITFIADLSAYRTQILSIAGVVNRQLVYNNSAFDDKTPGVGPNEDAAIATDKVAYQAGTGYSTFDSISSYSRGINSVAIDIASVHGTLTASDFNFRVGTNSTLDSWTAAPAPTLISVRPGAGVGGSDRVNIIWPDGAIVGVWLEITVKGNDATGSFNTNTGLAKSDVFYFGHRPGDSGSYGTLAVTTNINDELGARFSTGANQPITNVYDFDKDRLVNIIDQLLVRFNSGFLLMLNLPSTAAASALSISDETSASGLIELPPPSELVRQLPLRNLSAVELAFAELAGSLRDHSASYLWETWEPGFFRRFKR